MSKCWELKNKESNKPVCAFQSQLSDDLAHCVYENSGVSTVSSEGCNIPGDPSCCPVSGRVVPHDVLDNYKGFLSVGEVSVVGDANMVSPITILRDTGAAQSVMLDHILPELNMEPSKSHVLVKGFGGDNYVPIPLRTMSLKSDLVNGDVAVGGGLTTIFTHFGGLCRSFIKN